MNQNLTGIRNEMRDGIQLLSSQVELARAETFNGLAWMKNQSHLINPDDLTPLKKTVC
jgi:hypothetical protein